MFNSARLFPIIVLVLFTISCSDDSVNVIDIEDPAEVLDISVSEGFVVEVFVDDVDLPTSVEFRVDFRFRVRTDCSGLSLIPIMGTMALCM